MATKIKKDLSHSLGRLRPDHYRMIAEILYMASLTMESEIWKELVAKMCRNYHLHDKDFKTIEFLQTSGYADKMREEAATGR